MSLLTLSTSAQNIDRKAVISRNNPHVTTLDTLASLTVGNGGFAFTVDATGMQSFPKTYANGVALGTMSDWGWHSFANPQNYRPEEALKAYDFGHGHTEFYATQFKPEDGRAHGASEWYRQNPHRLHLGAIGLDLMQDEVSDIDQTLENIIFLELLRRGWNVTVGRVKSSEIDFVARREREKIYVQVCYLLAGEGVIEREFGAYRSVRDNYPKYVVSLDEFDFSRDGIRHMNAREFLLSEEWR